MLVLELHQQLHKNLGLLRTRKISQQDEKGVSEVEISFMIRDYPPNERPRERLLREGKEKLTNQELLAIIIRSGTKRSSALQLAQKILQHFEGLHLLKDASVEELMEIKGIGEAKAIEICAAIELGRRVNSLQLNDRYKITSPEDVSQFVMDEMRFLTQEHFVALYLDTKNHVIHKKTVFIGSLNSSIVHPREVFKEALKRSAASIIVLHNHPSGVRLYGA